MPLTEFEKAFSDARAKGKKNFGFQGKMYSTKTKEEKIVSDVLQEYPGLQSVLNEDNAKVSLADKKRKDLNKRIGGGGGLETWFPDDEGPEGFPHPEIGKYVFEIYEDKIAKDPEILKEAVKLDALHAMKNDEEWNKMRGEFFSKFHPKVLEWEKNKIYPERRVNEEETFEDYMDRTALDGYLRGGLNSISDKKLKDGVYVDQFALNYRGLDKDNESFYTKEQKDIINKMNEYLKSKKKK